MRISDWSSDVCSSDLRSLDHTRIERRLAADDGGVELVPVLYSENRPGVDGGVLQQEKPSRPLGAVQRRAVHRARVMDGDGKSVVEGKSVSVRGNLGGRRFIKQKNQNKITQKNQ